MKRTLNTSAPTHSCKAVIAAALIGTSLLTASCTLVNPEVNQTENPAVADKYNYMKRFLELQAQIDRLQSENARLSRKYESAELTVESPGNPQLHSEDNQNLNTSTELTKTGTLTEKAERLLGYIDSLIEQFSSTKNLAGASSNVKTGAGSVSTTTEAAASGVLIRDEADQVVASIPTDIPSDSQNTHEQEVSWNYSVVYRYNEEAPWNLTWDALEAAGEKDKWKGVNTAKESYFVYVGVYATEHMARKRQSSMDAMIGYLPDVDIRRGNSALASN